MENNEEREVFERIYKNIDNAKAAFRASYRSMGYRDLEDVYRMPETAWSRRMIESHKAYVEAMYSLYSIRYRE